MPPEHLRVRADFEALQVVDVRVSRGVPGHGQTHSLALVQKVAGNTAKGLGALLRLWGRFDERDCEPCF